MRNFYAPLKLDRKKIGFFLSILSFTFLLSGSCEKELTTVESVALVLDYGDPVADGCGWVLKIGDTIYKPKSIPQEFLKDSLTVKIKFVKLDTKWDCGFYLANYVEIELKSIINSN